MKCILLLILFPIIVVVSNAQTQDSLVCLPKSNILTLANKIKLLKDTIKWQDDIILNQDTLIGSQKKRIILSITQLDNRQTTINLLEKENTSLRETIEILKPKWYNDKWLWFGNGVAATLITVLLLK